MQNKVKRKMFTRNGDEPFDSSTLSQTRLGPRMYDSPFIQIREIERPSSVYEVFLSDDISDACYYTDFLTILHNATDQDEVHIHLNTNGGCATTTLQIITAMANSKAMIVTFANGTVASAGTFIFLSGDVQVVNSPCIFMCHNYSSGFYGKGHEIQTQADFSKKFWDKLIYRVYEGFLTEEEIQSLIKGEDYYFDGEETATRLQSRIDHFITREMARLDEEQEEQDRAEKEARAKAKSKVKAKKVSVKKAPAKRGRPKKK